MKNCTDKKTNATTKRSIVKKYEKAGKKVPNSLLNRGGGGGENMYFQMYGGLIKPMMYGGKAKPMAYGGRVGSDSVPAMLTPGEFVVNKAASKEFLPILSAINGTKYPSMLGNNIKNVLPSPKYPSTGMNNLSTPTFNAPTNRVINSTPVSVANTAANVDNSSMVYNYNIGITVGGTNSSPNNIARAVIDEIKYIDSQRVRTQRAV